MLENNECLCDASNYVTVANWDIHLDIHEINWLPDGLSHYRGTHYVPSTHTRTHPKVLRDGEEI